MAGTVVPAGIGLGPTSTASGLIGRYFDLRRTHTDQDFESRRYPRFWEGPKGFISSEAGVNLMNVPPAVNALPPVTVPLTMSAITGLHGSSPTTVMPMANWTKRIPPTHGRQRLSLKELWSTGCFLVIFAPIRLAIFAGLMPSLKRQDMAVKRIQREIAVT